MTECQIRQLRTQDVAAGLQLCRAAGWNQLGADWQTLVAYQPDGCFAAVCEEQLVGTVTTTSFGTELAWIGMMLVDERFRRQGIASRLMTAAMDYLMQHGIRCIKLDATPAGRFVYEKLGFQPELDFHRWQRDGAGDATAGGSPVAAGALGESAAHLDRQAFGANRWPLLEQIAARSRVVSCENGFAMLRPGYLASYLGPVVATSPAVAETLLEELIADCSERVFWDIPSDNRSAVMLARSLRFDPARLLTRMWFGEHHVAHAPTLLYALADPSIG